MAVQFVGSATAGSTTAGASSITVTAPAQVTAGDSLLLVCSSINFTPSIASGWTLITGSTDSSHRRRYYKREAVGDETDNAIVATGESTSAIAATMVAYRGVDYAGWAPLQLSTVLGVPQYEETDATRPFETQQGQADPLGGAYVVLVSHQHSLGATGTAADWSASNGTLRADVTGFRPSFRGCSNGVIDHVNVSGEQSIAMDVAEGPGEYGGGVALVVMLNRNVTAVVRPDRYRSSISADAGSLLATTRAVPFDTSHTIAFSPAAELDQDALHPFHEATSIQAGTADVQFYPRARQSIDGPVVYDGVTSLTLMERVFPNQILITTTNAGLGVTASAQAIITYVFAQWAAQYAWFTYKPVPDLRMRDVSVTDDWASSLNLRLTTLFDTAIRVLQPKDNPRSMRAMLEDLLSPFPGTQFYMDAAGDLVLRPVYGPDADATPFKTLADSDVVTISIGEPSVDNIINRCTVSFRRFTEQDEVSVLEPAFVQVLSNFLQPAAATYLITAPVDRLDLSNDDGGFSGWRSIPIGEDLLLGDGGIAFEDTGGMLITAAVNTYDTGGTLQDAWTSPADLTVEAFNVVPLDGSTVLAFGVRRGAGYTGNSYYGRWNARYNGSTQAVEIQWAGGGLEVNTFLGAATARYAQMSVTINGVSRAWAEGATISSTFGVVDDGDFVPGPSGTNALSDSVTAYGVLEERFEVRGYGALSAGAIARISEAYVIQNLTPRATREIALTWKGAVGLEFDDRGRLVGIPDDGEGFLVGRRYADDFIATAGAVTATVEETVPGSPGTIDLATVYLLGEDGGIWMNENGTASTPA